MKKFDQFEQKDVKNLVLERFIDVLEDLVTDPEYAKYNYNTDLVEKVRQGNKIRYDSFLEQKLIVAGQDFRLSWKEIDQLKKEIFE